MYFYEVFLNSHPKVFIFFFQAEDGIRDYMVTGVQTCALPILEQQSLQFRGQRTPGNLKAAVRGSELGERVGHRLTCDHQGAGGQDHEGEQERGSCVHENTTTRRMIGWLRYTAFPLIDATEGLDVPVETFRSTSRKEPGSSAHETFKVVTTLASVCVAYSGFRSDLFKRRLVVI